MHGIPETLSAALRACGLPLPYALVRGSGSAWIVRTGSENGKTILAKTRAGGPADFFLRQREGLEALDRAGSGLRFPEVIGIFDPETEPGLSTLVLEYLEPQEPSTRAWEDLGRGLARLHRATGPAHGGFADNYLGDTLQLNGSLKSWPRFFAERRIARMAGLLYRAGRLSIEDLRIYEKLLEKIPSLLGHDPAPALLHGDPWIGNFLATDGGPALIDPAGHYGDRETDLAMMRLFGGFPEIVFEAYREAFPLLPGWRERQPLYQLYHLMNHQLLFGGDYGGRAMEIARSWA